MMKLGVKHVVKGPQNLQGTRRGDGGAHRYRRVSQRKAVGLGDVFDVVWYLAAAERVW